MHCLFGSGPPTVTHVPEGGGDGGGGAKVEGGDGGGGVGLGGLGRVGIQPKLSA